MEEKLGNLFDEIASDESLDGKDGREKIMEIIFNENRFPEGFSKDDVNAMIESIEIPESYTKDSFIAQFNDILTLLKTELIPDIEKPDPEDEELLRLNKEFIAERLSDLQQIKGGGLTFALTSFNVVEADIADISELSDFHSLFQISLRANSISDASPLNGLKSLKELNISENKLVTFENIELTELINLDLSQNKFCNIGSALLLPKLKILNLSQNSIMYISPSAFSRLTELEQLDLSQNKLSKFRNGVFENLSNLKNLDISQNQFTIIEKGSLNGLEKLEQINVGENPIEDIIGFESLTSVKIVDMHGSAIGSIDNIKVCTELKCMQTIILEGSPIQSLDTFKSDIILLLPWLEKIDEDEITFQDRQDALELDKERKEAERLEREEAERLEREEAERREREAAEAEEAENQEEELQDGAENMNDRKSESAIEGNEINDSEYTDYTGTESTS